MAGGLNEGGVHRGSSCCQALGRGRSTLASLLILSSDLSSVSSIGQNIFLGGHVTLGEPNSLP